MAVLYIVIPCYNEEAVLPETNSRLIKKLSELIKKGKCAAESRILYVDDGSRDKTWELIARAHEENSLVCGLKLAHNKGHQNALLAGLMSARELCDCTISMDADLQDDVEIIEDFMDKYLEGYEVVYGVRSDRKSDTFFKRATAQGYYKFMKKLGVDLVYNHADCRLMGSRALEAMSHYRETNLFLRGIVPSIGFKSTNIYYERAERFAGESKYPLKKMLYFAWDGITSFSVKPLKLITKTGVFFMVLSILGLIYSLIAKLVGFAPAGIPCIVSTVGFFSSLILIALGVTASYIGKMYSEVKDRPRYIIDEFLK